MSMDQTVEPPTQNKKLFHPVLRGIAHVISVVLHPLFVPLIGTWLIIKTHYYEFAGFNSNSIFRIYGSVIANTLVLPAFTVLFLKLLKFIQSIKMNSRRERIIPYIATMTFYFWAYMVFRHQQMMPVVLTAFLLGNFIAVIFAFISNIFIKISMHTLGMGGLLGLAFCFLENPYVNVMIPLMAVILLCGIVATSRLILEAHSMREIYLGVIFGVLAQLIAFWIL